MMTWLHLTLASAALVLASSARAATLEIGFASIPDGIEVKVEADFLVETVGFGLAFDNPCEACSWVGDPELNRYTAQFGAAYTAASGENIFAVSATSMVAKVFEGSPQPLHTDSPMSFRLGQISFNGPDPELLRPIDLLDPEMAEVVMIVGLLATDASSPKGEQFVDFHESRSIGDWLVWEGSAGPPPKPPPTPPPAEDPGESLPAPNPPPSSPPQEEHPAELPPTPAPSPSPPSEQERPDTVSVPNPPTPSPLPECVVLGSCSFASNAAIVQSVDNALYMGAFQAVPEPGTWTLLGVGLLGALALRRLARR